MLVVAINERRQRRSAMSESKIEKRSTCLNLRREAIKDSLQRSTDCIQAGVRNKGEGIRFYLITIFEVCS